MPASNFQKMQHKRHRGSLSDLKFFSRWALNMLIWLDQGVNAIFWGDPDETISSRLGKIRAKHKGEIPPYRIISFILDKFLDAIDHDHTLNSIEEFEGSDQLLDRVEMTDWTRPYELTYSLHTRHDTDRCSLTVFFKNADDPEDVVDIHIPLREGASAIEFILGARAAMKPLLEPPVKKDD